MPEPTFKGFPEWNFITEALVGTPKIAEIRHLLQISGLFRAVYFPTGNYDVPAAGFTSPVPVGAERPPPGRVRFKLLDNRLQLVDNQGNILPILDFLKLADTPASFAGAGLQGVRVNAAENALEFSAVSGGAQPLYSFPTHFHPENVPVLFTRSSIVHYAGWSLCDTRHDGNVMGDAFPVFGREQDATSLRRLSFVRFEFGSGGVNPFRANFHTQIPTGFSSFGANGVTLRHRLLPRSGAPQAGDVIQITLDVYDPANAAEVVAATAVRALDLGGGGDAGYFDVTVPAASLNAAGFAAGDLLRLEMVGLQTAQAFGDTGRINCGRLLADFQ